MKITIDITPEELKDLLNGTESKKKATCTKVYKAPDYTKLSYNEHDDIKKCIRELDDVTMSSKNDVYAICTRIIGLIDEFGNCTIADIQDVYKTLGYHLDYAYTDKGRITNKYGWTDKEPFLHPKNLCNDDFSMFLLPWPTRIYEGKFSWNKSKEGK